MAMVVVGGNGRGVGKTALVCGVMAALPEFGWIAVKISTETYAGIPLVHEESTGEEPDEGQRTDTERYLAAGARRAFLVAATDDDFGERMSELRNLLGPEPNLIFESNRVLRFLEPDVCLAIEPDAETPRKPSFSLVEREEHVSVRKVRKGSAEQFLSGAQPEFELADFERLSEPMRQWLRERLNSAGRRQALA